MAVGRVWIVVLVCLSLHCCLVQETDHVMAFLDSGLVLRSGGLHTTGDLLASMALWRSTSHYLKLAALRNDRLLSTKTAAPGGGDAGWAGGRWTSLLGRYLRSLRWTPIPLSLGFALIAYQRYRHVVSREQKLLVDGVAHGPVLAAPWEVSMYRMLPLRHVSRLWGWINDCQLPVWARHPVINWYVRTFGCDLSEAVQPDLRQYRNLGEFFRRQLRPDLRPVDLLSDLVSPADGTVLHLGRVESGRLEQVKGVTYTLPDFMGPCDWDSTTQTSECCESSPDDDQCAIYHQRLTGGAPGGGVRRLYQCVVYLAPGDYHRFHSPADWRVRHRRHFPGHLLSVSPAVAAWLPSIFCLNERALYTGRWKHGFFSLTAVGATNVGSIRVYCDQELTTNSPGWQPGMAFDRRLNQRSSLPTDDSASSTSPLVALASVAESDSPSDTSGDGVALDRGQMFGEFNLGSTVVLVFEAPDEFEFSVKAGQRVRVGQSMGRVVTA